MGYSATLGNMGDNSHENETTENEPTKPTMKKDIREFFDEMDTVRGNKRRTKINTRQKRRTLRAKAIQIINELTVEYGAMINVPETNELLKQAREWLGVFDDDVQETNVANLRLRVTKLSRKHKLRQADIYQLLGYHLDLNMQTVKDKTYNNRFTIAEGAVVWKSLAELERTENLNTLVRAYETRLAKQEMIRERREKYQLSQALTSESVIT